MAEKTKITLSDAELAIVQQTEWFLTKHRITKKVYALFNNEVPSIKRRVAAALLPAEIALTVPRIYKGENYRLFPYIMMDYPAVFSRENIFATRTMFWWGHFVSVSLHLAGSYKSIYEKRLIRILNERPADFYICVNKDQWQHHFGPDNYTLFEKTNAMTEAAVSENSFMKIALKLPLGQWNDMHQLLDEAYEKIINLLKD